MTQPPEGVTADQLTYGSYLQLDALLRCDSGAARPGRDDPA
ncbi:MAG: hypothetical protein ACR2KJ_04335 [Jatrophihabitans sp.]